MYIGPIVSVLLTGFITTAVTKVKGDKQDKYGDVEN